MLQEWSWKERFAAQADTHDYIRRVAMKHDLYRDIQFHTRIKSATWDEGRRIWTFKDETGRSYRTRLFVSCLGFLSSPTLPNNPGIKDFAG